MKTLLICFLWAFLGSTANGQLISHLLAPLTGFMQPLPHIEIPIPTTMGSEVPVETEPPIRNDINDDSQPATKIPFSLENLFKNGPTSFQLEKLFNLNPSTSTSKPTEATTLSERKFKLKEKSRTPSVIGASADLTVINPQSSGTKEEIPAFRVDNEVASEPPATADPTQALILQSRRFQQLQQRPSVFPQQEFIPQQHQQFFQPQQQQQQQQISPYLLEAYRRQQKIPTEQFQQPLAFSQDSQNLHQNQLPVQIPPQQQGIVDQATTPRILQEQDIKSDGQSPWAISQSKRDFNRQPNVVDVSSLAQANETVPTASTPNMVPPVDNGIPFPTSNIGSKIDDKNTTEAKNHFQGARRLQFADEGRLQQQNQGAVNGNQYVQPQFQSPQSQFAQQQPRNFANQNS